MPSLTKSKLAILEGERPSVSYGKVVLMNKKNKFSFLVLLLGILLGVGFSLPAQEATGVEGHVKGYEGNPMVGGTVEAKSNRGGGVYQEIGRASCRDRV